MVKPQYYIVRHQTSCILRKSEIWRYTRITGRWGSILVAFFSAAHGQGLKCIKFTLDVFICKISTIIRNNNKKNFIQLSALISSGFLYESLQTSNYATIKVSLTHHCLYCNLNIKSFQDITNVVRDTMSTSLGKNQTNSFIILSVD